MNKRLYRSKKDTVIGGVCGGMAEYLDIDPTLIRLIWAISVLFLGFGVMIYIICLIVIPETPVDTIAHKKESVQNQQEIIVSAKMEDPDSTEDQYHTKEQYYEESQDSPQSENSNERNRLLAGILLISLGGLLLAKKFLYWIDLSKYWPVLLIMAGLLIIIRATGNKEEAR